MSTTTKHRGVPVSRPHRTVLAAADRAGVQYDLNDGRRSMAGQQHMVATKGLYNPITNPHGAARPNPNAPHIWEGRENHALDVTYTDGPNGGGARRLARFYAKHGAPPSFNVSTEPWHSQVLSEPALLRAARRLADPRAGFSAEEKTVLRQYDRWKKRGENLAGRKRLRAWMRAQRKRIWRAAQPKSKGGDGAGWTKIRRKRYAALLARSN